jgi:hypothetical protein
MGVSEPDTGKPQTANPSSSAHPLIALYLTASVVMLPALLLGAMANGTDSIFHARWMHYFAAQFWSGELYPRWLMDMNGGFGSPAFFIYPPFSQFVTALLHPLFPKPQAAAALLGISVWLAMAASGITCFYWLRQALPGHRLAAVGGALVYMLAPYHLSIDVYQRGAVAEVWAFVWPPLSLLLVHGLERISPSRLASLGLSIGGLLITHAPSSLILIPGYFLYALVLDWQDRRLVRCLWLVVGCGLGCLLAGWYLGPALTHTRYINAAALFGGRNTSTNWLIGGGGWPDPVIQRAVYIAVGLQGLVALITASFAWAKSARGERGMAVTALLLATVALLMMSILSLPIWELGLPLNQVQFPWRFGVLLSLAVALAVAVLFARVTVSPLKIAVIPAIFLVGNGVIHYFPADYPMAISSMAAKAGPEDNSWDAPEYQLAGRAAVENAFGVEDARLVSGKGTLYVREWRPRSIVIVVDLKQISAIAIRQFEYPGWTLTSTTTSGDQPTLIAGEPYLRVLAPPGQYTIQLTLAETLPERAGQMASLVAMIFTIGLLIAGRLQSGSEQD